MKKLLSMMMMLAIMVTALGFTACSDDDDSGGSIGNPVKSKITVTYDGKDYVYDEAYFYTYDLATSYEVGQGTATFVLQMYLNLWIELYFEFPYTGTKEDLRASDITDNFNSQEIDIRSWYIMSQFHWSCSYQSGKVTAKKIDDETFVITFKDYNIFIKGQNGKTHEMILNGSLWYHHVDDNYTIK